MLIDNLEDPSGYFTMAALVAFCLLPAALQNNVALEEFHFQAPDTTVLGCGFSFWLSQQFSQPNQFGVQP